MTHFIHRKRRWEEHKTEKKMEFMKNESKPNPSCIFIKESLLYGYNNNYSVWSFVSLHYGMQSLKDFTFYQWQQPENKKMYKLQLGVRQVKMSAKFSPYFPMDISISATANFHDMRGDKISQDDFFWLLFLGQWFFCCSSQKFLFNSIFCVSNTVCVGGFQGWKTSSFLWNLTSKNGIKAYDGNCNGFVAHSSSYHQPTNHVNHGKPLKTEFPERSII